MTRLDEKWVTDVTEFKVKEQKVYLSLVVDLFTQKIIVYNVVKNSCLLLVTDMLTSAISKLRRVKNLLYIAIKAKLKGLSPIEYRNQTLQAA